MKSLRFVFYIHYYINPLTFLTFLQTFKYFTFYKLFETISGVVFYINILKALTLKSAG